MVIAYEDIGLANMPAAQRAVTAVQAAEQVGFPEARIPLADAVIELCLSPKSNSGISAIDAAITQVKQGASVTCRTTSRMPTIRVPASSVTAPTTTSPTTIPRTGWHSSTFPTGSRMPSTSTPSETATSSKP